MSEAAPTIAAVVVTFNRLPLLRRLLERLRTIDRLQEILVVDNASTDGTAEWLATLDPTGTPVHWRVLDRNRGGAGGFRAGLDWAVERGADLAWLMDDDGLPAPDCLDTLLPHYGRLDFWGPAVVAEQDPARLCFPIRLPGRTTVVHDLADVEAAAQDGLIPDVVIPFNGVLVTRELVERIGSVREEFFIWGDDHEFRLRAERAGARIATVVDARFLHPATDDLGTPMLGGRSTYNHSPSDLKHYCMARNNLVNLRDYKGWPHALAFVAKTAWFYGITRPDPGRLRLSARAMVAGLRGRWDGHERFLRQAPAPSGSADSGPESVAVVVVTHNRSELLARMLDGLARLERAPDAVYVVDNASADETPDVIALSLERGDLPLVAMRMEDNLGGAGGFHAGVRRAHADGHDRIWLMDDDVIPAPDCLTRLLEHPEPCLIAVREDLHGALVEKAATRFDLRNPLAVRPKRQSVETAYGRRAAMPPTVPVDNVAFEGFLVHRRVIDEIGLPDESFFIFYDDVDFALRARRAGYPILAVRDAVLVRQLDFNQQHDLSGWKGYYMYRNLFAVHFRYGENPLVRLKPYAITAAALALSPLRGGAAERDNVRRALRDARTMGG